MNRARKWWIAAAGGLAVAAAIGIGAGAMAQTPVPGTGTGTTFLDRVAGKLGIESATLRDAVTSSANDEIDARVASGDLTQEQADAMKERVANAPDQAFGGIGRGGPGGHHGGPGGFGFFGGGEELAAFLGTDATTLRTEMQADGATLATVSESHGKSRDEIKAFLTDQIKAHLDEEVATGEHTQAEADAKLATFTTNLDAMIDGTPPQRGPGGMRRGPFGGESDGAPLPEVTPSSGATSGANNG